MRLGEVFGLKWDKVDFDARLINLKQQIIYLNRRSYFLTALKTESSNRYVLIDNFLLGELRRWKGQQIANEKIFGDSYVYIYREEES